MLPDRRKFVSEIRKTNADSIRDFCVYSSSTLCSFGFTGFKLRKDENGQKIIWYAGTRVMSAGMFSGYV